MADLQLAAYVHALADDPTPLVRILEGSSSAWRWDTRGARLVRA